MQSSGRASWRNPRVLTTLLLVFLAGGLVGAMTMREIHRRAHTTGTVFQPNDNVQLTYEQMSRDLNLNEEQAHKLRTILDDFVRYNQDVQAQIEDVRATGKNRIRSILNPKQRDQFEKLCAGWQAR